MTEEKPVAAVHKPTTMQWRVIDISSIAAIIAISAVIFLGLGRSNACRAALFRRVTSPGFEGHRPPLSAAFLP